MLVPWAAPRTRRQRVQWQCCMNIGSPAASNATAPQRQLPTVLPGCASTLGRSKPATPISGGYSSCCGRVSVMVYQGAFDPTKMCASGLMSRSPTSGPAGKNAIEASGTVIGTVDPQTVQLSRVPCGEDGYLSNLSSPRVHWNRSRGTDT